MIQFNKNTFGLAAGEALQVPQWLYSISYTNFFVFHGLSLMFFCD
jgi:hypothetical protein